MWRGILPERFGARVHTYVLMPNHYHLQIETRRLNLSDLKVLGDFEEIRIPLRV